MSQFGKAFDQCQSRWDNMSPPELDDYGPEEVIAVYRTSIHKARKDHYDRKGRLVVRKGFKYKYFYERGYFLDEDNKPFDHYVNIWKKEVMNQKSN